MSCASFRTSEKPHFYVKSSIFSGIQSRPLPVQNPIRPFLWVAERRRRFAARWHKATVGMAATPSRRRPRKLKALEETAKETERPASLGRLEITVTPTGRDGYSDGALDAETAKRFEDLGVDRLVLIRDWLDPASPPSQKIEDDVIRFLEEQAREHRIS